jgi:GMP synthase (glutamine-hydrolysing)
MRTQEVECFANALHCDISQISVYDLLSGVPTRAEIDAVDMVLLGGSGDYSVAEGGDWLPAALDAMRELYDWNKPTFASCWGFQAMAKALGGEVVTDMDRAELGTLEICLVDQGRTDPVFGPLPPAFLAHVGHQDIVDSLPSDAILLASTNRVTNQAFRIDGKPIYCTQFHPELRRDSYLQRLIAYPSYVERIAGVSFEEFAASCTEAPETETLLPRFVSHVFGDH